MAHLPPADRAQLPPLTLVTLPDPDRLMVSGVVPLTSFFGRSQEIATVMALLDRPDVRLLTLTGPGGIGKTRLAMQVAEEWTVHSRAGTAIVSLAPVRDPDLILPLMVQTLDVPDAPGQTVLERVRAFLRDQHLLLVLDNLEHLLDSAAPLVADLVATCPELTVLTTSRIRLGLSGERVVPVAPLDPETARTLFTGRAEAADPSFANSADLAPVIDAICDRLDRLPLAIELAAARISVLPPRAILARLDHRLDLLTGGPRDVPPRLRDIRDTIAWSHDLLPGPEQILFRRLGVFVGGFTLESAAAIAEHPTNVLGAVSVLTAASLVQRMDGVGDEPRFTMLETIREFALERLEASGEESVIRERHARYVVALSEHLWESPDWPRMESWFARLEPEIANVRLALTWGLEHDPAAAVQLAGALIEYWAIFGHATEGKGWVTRVLQACPEAPPRYRARALMTAGKMTMIQGDYATGTRFLTEADAHLKEAYAEDPNAVLARLLTWSAVMLGDTALAQGDLDRASTWFTETCKRADQYDVPICAAIAIMNLGRIAQLSGDLLAAQELLEEALVRHQAASGPIGIAHGHLFLGELLQARGMPAQAEDHFQIAFTAFVAAGQLAPLAGALAGIAGTVMTSQPTTAVHLFGAAATIDESSGFYPQDGAHFDRSLLNPLRHRLGEAAYAAAWKKGTRLSLDELRTMVATLVDAPAPSLPPHDGHGLTRRELEVLQLVAAGHSNRDIAARLFISVPTVKRHITTILSKLDLPSRSAATAYAHTHDLT
jgi:predicted ATPase/DNA-binding CsgD family transcriptional regulator